MLLIETNHIGNKNDLVQHMIKIMLKVGKLNVSLVVKEPSHVNKILLRKSQMVCKP